MTGDFECFPNISEIPDMIEISEISEIETIVKAWLVVDNVPLHR